jgi:hypothetical protein
MSATRVTLDSLRDALHRGNRAAFVKQYPGVFLLAMGFLAVEKILACRTHGQAKQNEQQKGKRDSTEAVVFGTKLKHDAGQSHPLAGIAFFLQSTQETLAVSLGRHASCDIVVPDGSVSDRHCLLELTPEGARVRDQGTTNGTTINLERLTPNEPKLLGDEDILSLGRYSFQFLNAKTLYDELALLMALDRS